MTKSLLMGCGNRRVRLMHPGGVTRWDKLVTLDWDEACIPDVLWDLNVRPLPFPDNHFDEIHAYAVLEHIGTQGNVRTFFAEFADYWRVLRPGGYLCAIVPTWDSEWAWGDPGHTRVITRGTLAFLSQDEYIRQVGRTPMADYRTIYSADFQTLSADHIDGHLHFILQAVKS